MDERRKLNQGGAVYPGARAVVIPARTGATGEPTTRRVVVAADRRSFTLDDGQVYERLSGALWSQRRSPDVGTLLVRQACTEGAALFDGGGDGEVQSGKFGKVGSLAHGRGPGFCNRRTNGKRAPSGQRRRRDQGS